MSDDKYWPKGTKVRAKKEFLAPYINQSWAIHFSTNTGIVENICGSLAVRINEKSGFCYALKKDFELALPNIWEED